MGPSVRAVTVVQGGRGGPCKLPDSVDDRCTSPRSARTRSSRSRRWRRPPDETVVVVGSGGCTALSLLAAGAGRVVAVDLNRVQNLLAELKAATVGTLEPAEAVGVPRRRAHVGGRPRGALPGDRPRAGAGGPDWWDAHPKPVWREGVLGAGVTERFIGGVIAAGEAGDPPARARSRRLLACRTLEEQRELLPPGVGHRPLAAALHRAAQPGRVPQDLPPGLLRARREPELRRALPGPGRATR